MANKSSRVATVSDVRVPLTVPQHLADDLRRLAERDCSSLSATIRRLLARHVPQEIALLKGVVTDGK